LLHGSDWWSERQWRNRGGSHGEGKGKAADNSIREGGEKTTDATARKAREHHCDQDFGEKIPNLYHNNGDEKKKNSGL